MSDTYLVVVTRPLEGREEEYHTWYDEIHVPDLLALDGVVAARRFDQAAVGAAGPTAAGFVATYELDGDPAVVLQALDAGIRSGRIRLSDALDAAATSMTLWNARSQPVRADA